MGMMKLIGIIATFICLARFPEQIKSGIDVGSYVCKVVWVCGEGTFKFLDGIYQKDIAPQVEQAKTVDVTKP
jgi:hypothetical protein